MDQDDTLAAMATWEDVERIALALPETSEAISREQRHWRVKDKSFVWERPLRRSDLEHLGDAAPEGPILGARVEHEIAKRALIESDPDVYFTTPHFDGYPAPRRDRRRRAHRAHHRGVAEPRAQAPGRRVPRRG
jgi:hypothetical protein